MDIEAEGPNRAKFLARLQGEVAKRGVIDVLRNGVRHGPVSIEMFHGAPSPGNTKAKEQYAANVFSVTRPLRYSKDAGALALDLGVFMSQGSMPFGHALRAKRLSKKLGLRKFAELVGVSPTYLSQVEQCNVMPPTADRVKRMAELLGENPDE